MNKFALYAGLAIFLAVVSALLSLVSAGILMFALALVHADVPAVPALGFWASFGTLLVLSSVGAALKGIQMDAKV